PFGDESRKLGRAQEVAVDGDELGAPQFGDEPAEHRPVALVDRSDLDPRLVPPAIMQPGVTTPVSWAVGTHACTETPWWRPFLSCRVMTPFAAPSGSRRWPSRRSVSTVPFSWWQARCWRWASGRGCPRSRSPRPWSPPRWPDTGSGRRT